MKKYSKDGVDYYYEFPYSFEKGIDNNEFILHYQPIVLKDGSIKKVEALARWFVNGELLFPNTFLAIAKGLDFKKLDEHLFKLAIKEALKFISYNIEVHINLSPQMIHEQWFKKCLNEIPQNVLLEITEEEFFLDEYVSSFDLIKSYNIPIGIDDFGYGNWSFERLAFLEVDFIKLDRTIVKNLHLPEYFDLIQCLMWYFKNARNLQVTAEFVENESIFRLCESLGIDFFQGYYFGKPQGFDNLLAKFKD